MLACGTFHPDIIVDDFSLTARLTAKLVDKPRVSIRRTGDFPGYTPRNITRHHSGVYVKWEEFYRNCEAVCGLLPPKSLAEVCEGDANVIPGIRSIEALPMTFRNDPTYAFAGALIVPDSLVPTRVVNAHDIKRFLERNDKRPTVYVTLGSVLKADESIRSAIRFVLDWGFAVISNVDLPDVKPAQTDLFFYGPILPMHTVTSRAYLMIHHCGSGTYQYAITHGVPSICIGSRCYDRDDVAQRLEELGAARYIPRDLDDDGFVERFRRVFLDCVSSTGNWYQRSKSSLDLLKRENDETMASFDFETLLDKASSI